MPDYMYLLESRLSPEQRAVLERVQELSRVAGFEYLSHRRSRARSDLRPADSRSGLHGGGQPGADGARTGKRRRARRCGKARSCGTTK